VADYGSGCQQFLSLFLNTLEKTCVLNLYVTYGTPLSTLLVFFVTQYMDAYIVSKYELFFYDTWFEY